MSKYLFTSESVTEGHPDKICDQISDAILDALLEQDPMSRVACETVTTTGVVMCMGEITTKAIIDIPQMKAAGIKLMIVSNNHAPRVKPFAEQLELDFVPEGKKPLTFGYTKAIAKLGLNKKNVAAVGDQIFTDVLGSNLKGIRSIFVFPIEPETSLPFRFKRACEKPFLPKLK